MVNLFAWFTIDPDFETEILPGLVEKEFPNIKLEVTKLPDDQYYTALKTKLASGECPDIILVHPKYAGANGVINLAKAGYLEPLTDLKVLDKVGEGARDAFTYDGEIYGVGSNVSMLGTYFNKDRSGTCHPQGCAYGPARRLISLCHCRPTDPRRSS